MTLDVHDKATRSRNMAAIRSSDTKPELMVRKIAWGLGYRYRINHRTPFGRPDLTFVRAKKAIFVHGCFWHRHASCRFSTIPATNRKFWAKKFAANVERDQRTEQQFLDGGWAVLTLWECEIRDLDRLAKRIQRFLKS